MPKTYQTFFEIGDDKYTRPSGSGGDLPTFPVTAMLCFYPLWWALGVADMIWVVTSSIMLLYLLRMGNIQAPRSTGLWLAFLLWMSMSVVQLEGPSKLFDFTYRGLHYYGAFFVFLYLYNARRQLTERFVYGSATVLWGVTVVGGFLGILLQGAVFRTPLSYVLPDSLVNNSLVNRMVIRRFSQFNADGFVDIAPRPSAPFLYTNNWGNAYSLLIPFVIAYMCKAYGQKRFWVVATLLPISLIPALSTLNRGMFLGLAVGAAYVGLRYVILGLMGVPLAVLAISALVAIGSIQLGVQEAISDRTTDTSTTEDRAEIYTQTLEDVRSSPLLGMGAPRPSENPNIPPVGTHGQFWTVIHSHGVPAAFFFMSAVAYAFVVTFRRRDATGILMGSVILMSLVESFYYGFLPAGLYLMLMACAMALRGVDSEKTRHRSVP